MGLFEPIQRHTGKSAWVGIALALCLNLAHAEEDASRLATGAALQQKLDQPISVVWSEMPLRQALQSLSDTRKVAFVLDRRIDPGRKLELSLNNQSLETILQVIARQCNFEVVRMESVVYLGPPNAAKQLRALIEREKRIVRRLPSAVAGKFEQAMETNWDDLTEPRELLTKLGRENGLTIEELDEVPHDLWAAGRWPPMSLTDRLLLITNQFDLTFEIARDGRKITLSPISDSMTETFGRLAASRPSQTKHAKSKKKPTGDSSDASQSTQPTEQASGKSDDIELVRIERLAVQEKPIGPVLHQLADRLKLDLQMDEKAIAAAGISLDTRVSINVENASVDDILGALLKTTGLTFHREQNTVVITPAK